jgi:hypothetical protein
MNETDLLREELEHYRREKEAVRKIIGQIGGKSTRRADRTVNIAFIMLVSLMFAFDIVRNIIALEIPHVPEMMFLELAVLLVSVKIIWMIHRQAKVEHFQFWILNSIEFQMNGMARQIREISSLVRKGDDAGEQ